MVSEWDTLGSVEQFLSCPGARHKGPRPMAEEQQGCTSGNIKWNLNTGSPRQPTRGKLSQTGEKKVGEYQTAESGDSEKKPAEILMTIKY